MKGIIARHIRRAYISSVPLVRSLSTLQSTQQDAMRGFRKLLRTVSVVFKDDTHAIETARETLKEEFRKNASVSDPKQLEEMFAGIDEVDQMLRFNIVQGRMNERGNYQVDLSREETQTMLEAGKDLPLGVEFTPVDASAVGDPSLIKVTKTKGKDKGSCA